MKRSRGLTFIEVITALAITAILLPVVGIAFYQVLVVPPNQSAQITVTDEVQRLATMLYQDGYMATNFSAGDGNPYYGTFSWVNYSVTPAQQYIVSYKATCPNPSDPYCINNIVRQVDHQNVSTPTPTPISTPTSYTLTTRVVGTGSITPASGSTYVSGTGFGVTATAASGWTFSSWFGDLSGNTSPQTITMNSNKDITAVFTQDVYTLTTSVSGNGSISANAFNPHLSGSIITLTATADPGWSFSGWSGSITNSSTTTTITMNANKSVTATFTQITYTLTTSVAGSGGSITPSSGSYSYASGSVVQVNAIPNTNWAFSSWSSLSDNTSPATITMNSNKSITATFINVTNPRIYTTVGTDTWTVPPGVSAVNVLVVGGGGGGGGDWIALWGGGGGGGGQVKYNASYPVTAGSNITVRVGTGGDGGTAPWTSGEDGVNGGNSSFGTITAVGGGGGGFGIGANGGSGGGGGVRWTTDYVYGSAIYGAGGNNGGNGYYGTTSCGFLCWVYHYAAGGGGGAGAAGVAGSSATHGGAGGDGVNQSSIFGTGVGASGWFGGGGGGGDHVTGGNGGTGGGARGADGNENGDDCSVANSGGGGGGAYSGGAERRGGNGASGIVIVNYSTPNYTLTTSVVNGTITPNGSYALGSNVTVTANPSNSNYTFTGWSGNLSGTTNSTTILMNSNKSVTATFALTTYNLTTSVVGSGTVTPNTSNPHLKNYVVQVNATASTGWTFSSWSGDLSSPTDPNPTTITMNSAKAVTATFTRDYYTLNTNVSVEGSGAVFTNTSNPHASGSTVLVTAIPANGWAFSNWSGDLSGTTNTTTIIMNSNKSGIANFTQNPYTLTITKIGNGSVAASPVKATYNYGDVVTLTPTADAGWTFSGFSPASPVTITGATTVTATFLALATTSTATFLSWHIASDNFRLTSNQDYIMANMTASINTSAGKYVQKQLTIYITLRAGPPSPGRGGIWGEDAVLGLGSLTISGDGLNLFNGDLNVSGGTVTVTARGNRVSGTLFCCNLSPNDPAFLQYGNLTTRCLRQIWPYNIGVPEDYFQNTNLSTGTQDWNQADVDNEYVFNSSVNLTGNTNVYNSSTRRLKDGYYYCNDTITLSGSAIRGTVTFIAKKIIINNTDTTSNESYYIGLEPYDNQGLLLWATGNSSSGDDILIQGTNALYHPCVMLEGILLAPSGEIELQGTGSQPASGRASSKAIIQNGGIMAQNLSISGHDWWIYRW